MSRDVSRSPMTSAVRSPRTAATRPRARPSQDRAIAATRSGEAGSPGGDARRRMRIATFNVNGVNGRLPALLAWLEQTRPDIVCLQELKAPQDRFPAAAIEA